MLTRALLVLSLNIASVALADSNPPSASAEAHQQSEEEDPGQKNRSTTKQLGTLESPLVIETARLAPTDQERPERDSKFLTDWLVAGSTIWLAIVTTLLAIYTYKLWSSADKNVAKQLRAYISVLPGPFTEQTSETKYVAFPRMRNSGLTPARHVRTVGLMDILSIHPSNDDFALPKVNASLSSAIGSQGDLNIVVVPDRWFTANDISAFKRPDAQQRIFIWGRVEYQDIFDNAFFTNFCFYMIWEGGKPGWMAGPFHNDFN